MLFSIPAFAASVKFTSNFNNTFTNFSAQESLPVHIQVESAGIVGLKKYHDTGSNVYTIEESPATTDAGKPTTITKNQTISVLDANHLQGQSQGQINFAVTGYGQIGDHVATYKITLDAGYNLDGTPGYCITAS